MSSRLKRFIIGTLAVSILFISIDMYIGGISKNRLLLIMIESALLFFTNWTVTYKD